MLVISAVAAIPLALLAVAGIVLADRLGRRAGMRQTIPWRPIFQLVEHRTRCLGQEQERVKRELGAIFGIPPWAWHELRSLRRPLVRRTRPVRSLS